MTVRGSLGAPACIGESAIATVVSRGGRLQRRPRTALLAGGWVKAKDTVSPARRVGGIGGDGSPAHKKAGLGAQPLHPHPGLAALGPLARPAERGPPHPAPRPTARQEEGQGLLAACGCLSASTCWSLAPGSVSRRGEWPGPAVSVSVWCPRALGLLTGRCRRSGASPALGVPAPRPSPVLPRGSAGNKCPPSPRTRAHAQGVRDGSRGLPGPGQ